MRCLRTLEARPCREDDCARLRPVPAYANLAIFRRPHAVPNPTAQIQGKTMNKFRMLEWLLISIVLLLSIALIAPQQLGVSLYKLSLITTAAWLAYWIDRSLFPYARPDDLTLTAPIERAAAMLRRAIIVGSAMLSASLGA